MFDLNIPLLSLLIWTPLLGGILLFFINQKNDSLIKLVGFTFSILTFFISIVLLINFDTSQYLLQFVEKRSWITTLNINYHLAVDGFSILFILFSNVIISISIFVSLSI